MGERIQRSAADPFQQFPKVYIAGELGPQSKVVDENPNQFFHFGAASAGDWRSDNDIFLCGVPRQQDVEYR